MRRIVYHFPIELEQQIVRSLFQIYREIVNDVAYPARYCPAAGPESPPRTWGSAAAPAGSGGGGRGRGRPAQPTSGGTAIILLLLIYYIILSSIIDDKINRNIYSRT